VIDEENTVVETNNYRSSTKTRRNPLLEGRRAIPLACLERRSYGEPALLKSGVEPSEGGQMPGKKYLTNANTTKEGFTGKEKDKESGSVYFGARNYDPTIGRFQSVDAFAEKYLSLNAYQYTANNPINFIDVNGDSIFVYDENGIKYEYRDGKYYDSNGNEYKGHERGNSTWDSFMKLIGSNYKGFLGKVYRYLKKIESGENGRELIADLVDAVDGVNTNILQTNPEFPNTIAETSSKIRNIYYNPRMVG
jgi:RHS repeat-associated protein